MLNPEVEATKLSVVEEKGSKMEKMSIKWREKFYEEKFSVRTASYTFF